MDGKHTEKRSRMRRPLWREGVGPVLVAAVLALGVAGSVDLINRHDREPDRRPAEQAADTDRSPLLKTSRSAASPRFVVAVRRPGTSMVVRDVRTGTDIGVTVAAPAGQRFQRVASAGDGSFVVAGYARRKVTFSRLRLGPEGRPRDLEPMPRVTIGGVLDPRSDMVVSPDGSRIAYTTSQGGRGRIQVLATANGRRSTWTTRLAGKVLSPSWEGERLSFVWAPARTGAPAQIRTLDVSGKGGDLAASRPVLGLPDGGTVAVLSRDGGTVLAGEVRRSTLSVAAYSTRTRQRTRLLWSQRVGRMAVLTRLTPDPTGVHLLADVGGRLFDGASTGVHEIPAKGLAHATW